MALVTTPGAADADSFASLAWATTYLAANGKAEWAAAASDALREQALRRATTWLCSAYRFAGTPTYGREQALAWPRVDAFDADGYPIASDEIPREVMQATAEAALREIVAPGSLLPDQSGAAVKREKLASMEVEYATSDGSRPAAPEFPLIDGILAPLLGGLGGGMVTLVRA